MNADVGLPQDVSQGLDSFVASAKEALGDDLVSIVLFGSAAEGRMRATSDVNVMLVLARFEAASVDRLREPLRLAHAAIRLEAMIVLESELAAAAEAFAVKFADIRSRHRVIAGRDVTAAISPSPGAMAARVRQILLNFILRTRERYVLVSLRDEQLAAIVADAAGPLRAAAEIMLQLEGRPAASPKVALELLARELDANRWTEPLARLSDARENGKLPPGVGGKAVLELVALAEALRARATATGR
jgi:predicted nucleotidyltransferase